MKVYVKKEDRQSKLAGIIATIIFLGFSIGVFVAMYLNGEPFIDALSTFGVPLAFAIVFFGFAMYFVFYLIKPPKSYRAKLISKKIDTYNDRSIISMEFSTQKESEQEEDFIASNYKCYTFDENYLIEGKDYCLKIKEFNWEPKRVEEITDAFGREHKKVAAKTPNSSLTPVCFAIGILFSILLIFDIIEAILNPQHMFSYVIFGIFCILAIFATFWMGKAWKADNKKEPSIKDYNQELEKISPLSNTQKKVGNMAIKYYLFFLIALPIAWSLIIFSIKSIPQEAYKIILPMVLFPEVPVVLSIIHSIDCDQKLIRKHNINIQENINIPSLKHFCISRPVRNSPFPQYLIVDEYKNLIFRIKQANFFGNKFIICDPHDIKIGEIKSKLFSITNEYTVNIVNESPFIVRSKLQVHTNFEVIGRDYDVKGDTRLIRNIIFDNADNPIAYISAVSKNNNNWYQMGNTEILLSSDVNNSTDIIAIALCVTMGNFQTAERWLNN